MRLKKSEKKEICLWCDQKKYGNYVEAFDVGGIKNCWCCFECQLKLRKLKKL